MGSLASKDSYQKPIETKTGAHAKGKRGPQFAIGSIYLRDGSLSLRTKRALRPLESYTPLLMKACADPFNIETEEGIINLGVAENKLLANNFLQKVNSTKLTISEPIPDSSCGFRSAVMELFKDTYPSMKSEFIQPTLGCKVALNMCAFALCDENDYVMIPTPHYSTFDGGLNMLFNAKVWQFDAFQSKITEELLDEQLKKCPLVKAMLIANPSNSLGTVYSKGELDIIVKWCAQNRVHLICDETYGQSCWDNSFQSVAPFMQKFPNLIHIVYGFGSDFIASGYQAGFIYTHNQSFNKMLENVKLSICPPKHVLEEVTILIRENREWMLNFTKRSAALLQSNFTAAKKGFTDMGVEIVGNACAGMFCVIDLRKYLKNPDWESEFELMQKLFHEYKVFINPGKAFSLPEPGYFRICFGLTTSEELQIALKRIAQFLNPLSGGGLIV